MTLETIESLNYILGIGGLVALLVTGILIFDAKTQKALVPLIQKWGLIVAFCATISGATLTLIYSEIFGFIPCGLCWFERILLYPQVLILGIALYYRDTHVTRYGIGLSIVGVVISLYHHYIQMGGSELIKCPAAGTGANCADRFMFEFGFVTFPFLSAILFAFLIALYRYIQTAQNTN